jgi:hypothetical protein
MLGKRQIINDGIIKSLNDLKSEIIKLAKESLKCFEIALKLNTESLTLNRQLSREKANLSGRNNHQNIDSYGNIKRQIENVKLLRTTVSERSKFLVEESKTMYTSELKNRYF